MFQTLKREYLFDIVIWLSSLHVVFVQNNIRFLLHFPIRVSNQHYKNSVTLKNQCIWSIFRPDSKQYKIGVSAIRGSVFGVFAVQSFQNPSIENHNDVNVENQSADDLGHKGGRC